MYSGSRTEEQEIHMAAAGRRTAVAVLGREGQEQRSLGRGLTPLLPSFQSRGPIFPDHCIPQAAASGLLIGLHLTMVFSARWKEHKQNTAEKQLKCSAKFSNGAPLIKQIVKRQLMRNKKQMTLISGFHPQKQNREYKKFLGLRLGLYWGFQHPDRQTPGQLLRADGSFDSLISPSFWWLHSYSSQCWDHLFTSGWKSSRPAGSRCREWNTTQKSSRPFS